MTQFSISDNTMCCKCIFWDAAQWRKADWKGTEVYLYDNGECHRYPPVAITKQKNFHEYEEKDFPRVITDSLDWCGEFQENPEAKIGFCTHLKNFEDSALFNFPSED